MPYHMFSTTSTKSSFRQQGCSKGITGNRRFTVSSYRDKLQCTTPLTQIVLMHEMPDGRDMHTAEPSVQTVLLVQDFPDYIMSQSLQALHVCTSCSEQLHC